MLHNIVVVDGVPRLKNDPWQDEEEELLAVEPKVICTMFWRVGNERFRVLTESRHAYDHGHFHHGGF